MAKKIKFMVLLSLVLLPIVRANPVTDIFVNGLIDINNFFAGGQWEPYASAIDFFLFSILFISIYMIGARYAFKEIKKPERVIVILLGLATAFVLILAGFSITLLLPYANWIAYLLLFLFLMWLIKGIENKFLRFIAALLLTLLILSLFQGFYTFGFGFCELWYFNWLIFILAFIMWLFIFRKAIKNIFWRFVAALLLAFLIFLLLQKICGSVELPGASVVKAPEVSTKGFFGSLFSGVAGAGSYAGNYFNDFSRNFQGIDLGFRPGTPEWASNLFGSIPSSSSSLSVAPETVPTPTGGVQAGAKKTIFGQIAGLDPKKYAKQEDYDKDANGILDKGTKELEIGGKKYKAYRKDGNNIFEEKGGIYNSNVDPNDYNNLLQELNKKSAAPSSTTTTTIPEGVATQQGAEKKSETKTSGTNWAWIAGIIGLVALSAGGLGYLGYKKKDSLKGFANKISKLKLTMPKFGRGNIGIEDVIRNSENAFEKMDRANFRRGNLLEDATKRTSYLEALTKGLKEPAMLFTDEGKKKLLEEHDDIKDILQEEFKFLEGLKELKDNELKLIKAVRRRKLR